MIQRCTNPNNKKYSIYGGRGIKVFPEWRADFRVFLRDMGLKPDPSATLERRNSDGHYEPGNVRWATPLEQANNTSRNRFVVIRGERMTFTQACRRFNKNYNVARWRLVVKGVSADEVFAV